MPRQFMNDLKGEVTHEKFHNCALGNDMLSADPNGEGALLLNMRERRSHGGSRENRRFARCMSLGRTHLAIIDWLR